jgi:CRISPR-associated protein Csx10
VKYYRIIGILRAPLMIQRDRQSNASMGMNYLPGSALRGALAAIFFRLGGGPEDKDFRYLFLEHPPCFPNLFPADDPDTISQTLPQTAMSCKRVPGFRGDGGHGVQDHLASMTFTRLSQQTVSKDFSVCQGCGNDLKPFSGVWNGDIGSPRKCDSTMIYQRHTGIDRATGTVAPTIFFTTQAIADFHGDPATGTVQPQYLSGGLFLDDEHVSILRPLFERQPLFVGAERTRGFGELDLSIKEAPSPVFNLVLWDKAFKEKFKNITGKELAPGIYFSLKFESHTIIVDPFLRPVSEITFSFPGIELLLKVSKAQTIRGWQSSWGLPKPDDIGVSAGSVFLLRYRGGDQGGLVTFLNGLVTQGIGLRREEGFGRVSVCDSLHIVEVI